LLELRQHYQIIAVSHSLRQARKIGGQILVLKEGKIVHQLDPKQSEDPLVLQSLLEEIF